MRSLYYRYCWHRVSNLLFSRYHHYIFSWKKRFTTQGPSSRTRRRSIRLSPIVEYSRLQPPVGVWTVLSSNVGGHALTPPTRHSLGSPLHYQQADRTQAAPKAINLYSVECIVYYSGFLRIIHDFGVRSYALLTRLPWPLLASLDRGNGLSRIIDGFSQINYPCLSVSHPCPSVVVSNRVRNDHSTCMPYPRRQRSS